jgi:hypothetical protein
MNAWPFVIAAYAVTGTGTLGLLTWAWRTMRIAEGQADALKRRT